MNMKQLSYFDQVLGTKFREKRNGEKENFYPLTPQKLYIPGNFPSNMTNDKSRQYTRRENERI